MKHEPFTRDPNRLWDFSGLVAEGMTPTEAGIALGKSPEYGNALMQRLRKRMGRQAI